MRVTIHRGTKEIGGTCVEVVTAKTRVVLDLGLPLVEPWNKKQKLDSRRYQGKTTKELLKLGLLPPVQGLYEGEAKGAKVDAVLLSHPHQDHYGLIGRIRRDIPVYLSDGARRILDASDVFLPTKARLNKPVIVEDRKPVPIGDITATPFLMDHSGFGAMAFLVEGEGKRLFYSGDFRAHGRKWKLFPKFLRHHPKDIDCLLMEGTTLGRKDQKVVTECDVEAQVVRISRKRKGLKLAYASGQNIDRLVSFYKAAQTIRGLFVVDLYTAYVLDSLGVASIPHPSKGFGRLKVFYTKPLMKRLAQAGLKHIWDKYRPFQIRERSIAENPGRVIMMYRDSLRPDVERIGRFQDSVLIYSLWEGYRRDESFKGVQSFLDKHGMAVESAHTSGHAGFQDLKRFVTALKPKVLVPIHTFEPGRYGELWNSVRALDDGETMDLRDIE